jgi:hypothetical protein
VAHVEATVNLARTLFIVSTKSGGTTETLSFFETFWERVHAIAAENTGKQFIAITDPGTSLQDLAREHGFRACYLNPPDIGGRYSALSYFGLIPAAVAGIDVRRLLSAGLDMECACAASVAAADNPGAWLGTVMAEAARVGRDKVTFFLSEEIAMLGLWLEQLLAESTGKEGKGLVPVPDNPPGAPADYGDDRLFVLVDLAGSESERLAAAAKALRDAGQPLVHLQLKDLYSLGAEFFRWEFATAVAGALLQINAFDQPNVQESKDNTKRLLGEFEKAGHLSPPRPVASSAGISVRANDAARALLEGGAAATPDEVLARYFARIDPPEYAAIMAYIAPTPESDRVLNALRVAIRDSRKVAVTLGYGPRFLHSTGQLHKGGPPEGIFLQITAGPGREVSIPGAPYSFGTLIQAQALGDFESLQQHGRPALSVHLADESVASLRGLVDLARGALNRQASTVR